MNIKSPNIVHEHLCAGDIVKIKWTASFGSDTRHYIVVKEPEGVVLRSFNGTDICIERVKTTDILYNKLKENKKANVIESYTIFSSNFYELQVVRKE